MTSPSIGSGRDWPDRAMVEVFGALSRGRSQVEEVAVARADARPTLADGVADGLVELIRERGLRAGDHLPATSELAEVFGVSRTVVREALADLAGRGLLRRQQGREGTFAVPGGEQLSRLLGYRMWFEDVSYDQLQDFREVVEIGAAELAAKNATGPDIARLSDALAVLKSATEEDAMLAADVEFHRVVAAATQNPLFKLMLDGLTPLLMESRRVVWQAYVDAGGGLERAIDRHVAIRDAIADRDPARARAAMAADLEDTRMSLAKAPRQRRQRRSNAGPLVS